MSYALFPEAMARFARHAADAGAERLRLMGAVALAAGAVLIWVARHVTG